MISFKMVLEAVKERATEYLKGKGLTGEDVGRVIGIFFFAKYITFISMIPLCHRLRPIRRLMKPLESQGRDYFTARRNKFQKSRIASAIAARTKGYSDWLKLRQPLMEERKNLIKCRVQTLQRQAQQFVAQKRAEQQERIKDRLKAKNAFAKESWSYRIFQWTERMADKVSKNDKWKTVAESFKVPPKDFAYAVGEGLVLYKLTSPLWMPAELFCIVKYLQWRRQRLDQSNA
jgi:hypothetical protein